MNRREAIETLVEAELSLLSRPAREALLVDWWPMDVDRPPGRGLPQSLQNEMAAGDGPGDASASRYDPIVKVALRHNYRGVHNAYLETRLRAASREGVTVEGLFEILKACPCCRYCTLDLRGDYDICKVCFWEDDGSDDAGAFSGPNHMTLGEGRANFRRLGAVTPRNRAHVLPDGPERYPLDVG